MPLCLLLCRFLLRLHPARVAKDRTKERGEHWSWKTELFHNLLEARELVLLDRDVSDLLDAQKFLDLEDLKNMCSSMFEKLSNLVGYHRVQRMHKFPLRLKLTK